MCRRRATPRIVVSFTATDTRSGTEASTVNFKYYVSLLKLYNHPHRLLLYNQLKKTS
jgi:hypothetical protein